MTWKILAMFLIKLMMLFRGSKSTKKFAAVEVENKDVFMGNWYLACYIPFPFQTRLSQVQYQLVDEGEDIAVIQIGMHKRKKKQIKNKLVASFRQSENSAWLNVDSRNPYQQQFKFIYLSGDGSQAIVVGPTMNTMRILYRHMDLSKLQLDRLISRAASLGFKTSKLFRVEQN